MKTITIGRSSECDIAIEHEHISRKHAIIKLYPMGKIEIIDMGRNGTSVNGIKIQPGIPKKVNRNDVITFAGAKTLDWSLVPKEVFILRWGMIVAGIIAVVLIVILVMVNSKKNTTTNDFIDEFSGPSNATSTMPEENGTKKDTEGWIKWPDFLKPTPKKKTVKKPAKEAPQNNTEKNSAGKASDVNAPSSPSSQKPTAPKKKEPAVSKPAQVIM